MGPFVRQYCNNNYIDIKLYQELELLIHGGGKRHVPMSLELKWFTLEDLGEHIITHKVEQLINFVFLKILIILLDFQDKV